MPDESHHQVDEPFRLLFEAAPNGAMVIAPDGSIASVNRQVEKVFGYSREELVGQSVELLMPERFRTGHKVLRSQFDHQTRPMGARPYLHGLRKDGTEFPVEIGLNPIDPDGTVLACIADASERKRNEEHIRLLMNELLHRSKNLLAVILSIAQQTGRKSTSVDDFQRRFEGRLLAIAHLQDILVAQSWTGAPVDALVQAQLRGLVAVDSQVSVAGPPIMLKPDVTQSIGLALHELATNAIKYGALCCPEGKVVIQWGIDDTKTPEEFRMSWREEGGPIVRKPIRKGFGCKLLTQIAQSVNGRARLNFSPEGLAWTIGFSTDQTMTTEE